VDIQAPDLETRSAIIRRELQARSDVTVSPEIIAFIAQRIESNVREIKGAINQILAAHDIGGEPVSLDMVQRVLDRLLERV
jgi:chromosomal replication initiator protein